MGTLFRGEAFTPRDRRGRGPAGRRRATREVGPPRAARWYLRGLERPCHGVPDPEVLAQQLLVAEAGLHRAGHVPHGGARAARGEGRAQAGGERWGQRPGMRRARASERPPPPASRARSAHCGGAGQDAGGHLRTRGPRRARAGRSQPGARVPRRAQHSGLSALAHTCTYRLPIRVRPHR